MPPSTNCRLWFLVDGREGEGRRPLYFASVDMERCYDNIHVHQLLDIVAGKQKPTRAFSRSAVSHMAKPHLPSRKAPATRISPAVSFSPHFAAQVLGEKPQDALGLGPLADTSRSSLKSTYCIRRYAIAHPFQSRDTVFVKHVREAYREVSSQGLRPWAFARKHGTVTIEPTVI